MKTRSLMVFASAALLVAAACGGGQSSSSNAAGGSGMNQETGGGGSTSASTGPSSTSAATTGSGGSCTPITDGQCMTNVPLSGALNATVVGDAGECTWFCAGGCGLQAYSSHKLDTGTLLVTITFPSSPKINAPGTFPVTVKAGVFDASTMPWTWNSWVTPDGACTVTVTNAECAVYTDNNGTPMMYSGGIIDATGHCSQDAQPDKENPSMMPVTIGDFTLHRFYLNY